MTPRTTPKPVRAWAIYYPKRVFLLFETRYRDAQLWASNGYTIERGIWTPDPPRRAKRKAVKRGK